MRCYRDPRRCDSPQDSFHFQQHQMTSKLDADDEYFNLFIIPQRVQKVIDEEEYKYTFDDEILRECKQCVQVNRGASIDILDKLMVTLMHGQNGKYFNFVVDRRANDFDKIYLIVSQDEKELNKAFHSFYTSYLLSFHFIICHAPKDVVRCYLNYAINEQMRWYPQHFVDFLPKLFKKPKYETMERYYTDYIRPIYRRNFRNAWAVDLFDAEFNEKYKKLTGYDHVAVNYNRKITKFLDGSPNEHEHQQSIKEYVDECGVDTDLNECKHLNLLMNMLKSTHDCQSPKGINTEKYAQISAAFDHLIRTHSLFSNDQLIKIKQYVASKCGGLCQHGNRCKTLMNYIFAKREATKEKMESLFNILRHPTLIEDKQSITSLIEWMKESDYDSDCLCDDIAYGEDSCLYKKIQALKLNEFCFKLIEKHMIQSTDDDNHLFQILYNMIHVYLLHDQEELHRMQNIDTNRFGLQLERKQHANDDYYAINFGQSVLCWLPFDEEPTFLTLKDEMISNPASTITTNQYNYIEHECKVKQENPSINKEGYTLKELVGMKSYCDTSEYQAALRKAFWDVESDEHRQMKKNFFHWAMTLYRAFLYGACPPNRQTLKSTEPISLYHGLNQILILNNNLPRYHGILSTSRAESKAHSFSKATGLLWNIKGSYTNRFTFFKGIDMQWISCHPEEQEFALFDQNIPIKSTRNYAKTDDEKINILMQQMKIFKCKIISPIQFYKSIGFKYKKTWIDKILQHKSLFDATVRDGMNVIDRLVDELHIDGLGMHVSIFSLAGNDHVEVNGTQIKVSCDRPMVQTRYKNTTRSAVIKINCRMFIIEKGCAVFANFNGHGFALDMNICFNQRIKENDTERSGGSIEIIAETVINHGSINCDGFGHGSGGNIKITAKRIENYGSIHANGGIDGEEGQITILCENMNGSLFEGSMEPEPTMRSCALI